MSRFEPKTYSYFLNRMAQRVVARSELTDLEEGGSVHTVLTAVARELDDLSAQTVNLQKLWDIDSATEEDLDARGEDFAADGLERLGATYATGTYVFSRSGTTGTVSIPLGSIVRVPGGGPAFETTASGSIANGDSDSASIPIIAQEAGSDSNLDADTITQIDSIPGVETGTNNTPTTGGQAKELDSQYRERLKLYIRSLPRGTPDALKFAVLSTELESYGKIVSAQVVELSGDDLGIVYVYVDDGAGTIVVTDTNTGTPEDVVASAIGGETRLQLAHVPVREGTTFALEINGVSKTEDTDYTLNRASGLIILDPTAYPTGLTASDSVTAEYTWYEGLIAEAQKIVDGDPDDRTNYPGYRAAGTLVYVRSPNVMQQTIDCFLILESGFDSDTVAALVQSAIIRYINSLPINGDVILSELIHAAQAVSGVRDIQFTNPTENIVIGDGEIARANTANVTVTA